ncbi:hypothetical protein CRU94_01400 [Arcobacter sp. AHV-9/2010]|uniref:TonB-dependent receptor n=1 Tax=Arcobacter sp. AHV-9/2010 TaxID=2021861 RepID=UPI00100C31E7|nr:TonB-dependent receptor [Arcobacter sp. CECT 9299]RXJ96793.1 hypothetical protein CRU94_01400 [Arcobacter sp. CECT 9299]
MFFKRAFLIYVLPNLLFSYELENILNNLNKYSDKTHLNIDYKPTAMTVLYAKDLESLGVQTLSEALDFIAGIQTNTGTSISSIVSVRGYSQPFNAVFEKIGYFINGVSVSSNYYENFPISLIDRIEISKGAALGLSNPNSFVASINIITKDKNNIAIGTGSFDKRATSIIINEKLYSWDIGLDFYYLKDNKKVDSTSANLTTEFFGLPFDRKKESLEGKEDINFGLSLRNGNFEFANRYIKNHKQNNYGFFNYLDFSEDGYTEYETFASELKYIKDISQNNKLETKLGLLQNNYKLNTYFYKLEPNNSGFYNPHYKVNYTQRESYLSLLLKNRTFNNHEIDYGVYVSRSSILKNDFYTNVDSLYNIGDFIPSYDTYLPISPNLTKFDGKDGFIGNTDSKTNISYYFNDTYFYSDNLSFSFLAKVDDYENYKPTTNFKLGSVYSNDNINIYKFVLSRTNKIPSLLESSMVGHLGIFGNSDLKAEEIQSAELMYIYGENSNKLKVNLYYSIYKNSIGLIPYANNTYKYTNKNEDEENYGIEFEYSKIFENRSKLLLNTSYNSFMYKSSDTNINTPIVSKVTANIGYIYPINSKFSLSSYTKYYGKREVFGDNKAIPDVVLFDLGASYNFTKNAKLSLNVKNILDTKHYYWGHSTTDEKMLREGRTWFASFSYDF